MAVAKDLVWIGGEKRDALVLLDVPFLLPVVVLVDGVNRTLSFRDRLLALSLRLFVSLLDLLGLSLAPVTVISEVHN